MGTEIPNTPKKVKDNICLYKLEYVGGTFSQHEKIRSKCECKKCIEKRITEKYSGTKNAGKIPFTKNEKLLKEQITTIAIFQNKLIFNWWWVLLILTILYKCYK